MYEKLAAHAVRMEQLKAWGEAHKLWLEACLEATGVDVMWSCRRANFCKTMAEK